MPAAISRRTPRALLVALGAAGAAMDAGCFESGCHITPHCEGNELHACSVDLDTGSWESRTDCAANGRVCRDGQFVECVYPAMPCSKDGCAGPQVALCGHYGLVTDLSDCRDEDAARTCFESARGPSCGYPDVACPADGADEVCAADGASAYSGCGADFGRPLHRLACDSQHVCVAAGGHANCVDARLIPCAEPTRSSCSADLAQAYFCSEVELVWAVDDCAARGGFCREGWCALDVPCDRAQADSRCSDDRSTLYVCGAGMLASSSQACPAGTVCTERIAAGRTFASCK